MKEVLNKAQAREAQLNSLVEELTQTHGTKMSHADEIISQQRQLLHKLRDECRNIVEVSNLIIKKEQHYS